MIRARFDDINLYVCVYSDVMMCVVCPFPEESLRFLYLGFLKTLNNSLSVSSFVFEQNFSKKRVAV